MSDHCRDQNVDSVLVSLDAKKAFDSVDHEYVRKTMRRYGFGPNYVNYFNVLYNDVSAKIMINGHLSESVDIKRGFKQGDASSKFFILVIDPLIRNIIMSREIKVYKASSSPLVV